MPPYIGINLVIEGQTIRKPGTQHRNTAPALALDQSPAESRSNTNGGTARPNKSSIAQVLNNPRATMSWSGTDKSVAAPKKTLSKTKQDVKLTDGATGTTATIDEKEDPTTNQVDISIVQPYNSEECSVEVMKSRLAEALTQMKTSVEKTTAARDEMLLPLRRSTTESVLEQREANKRKFAKLARTSVDINESMSSVFEHGSQLLEKSGGSGVFSSKRLTVPGQQLPVHTNSFVADPFKGKFSFPLLQMDSSSIGLDSVYNSMMHPSKLRRRGHHLGEPPPVRQTRPRRIRPSKVSLDIPGIGSLGSGVLQVASQPVPVTTGLAGRTNQTNVPKLRYANSTRPLGKQLPHVHNRVIQQKLPSMSDMWQQIT